MRYFSFFSQLACVAALAVLGVSSASAQVIVNDNFLDGLPQNSGSEPGETAFFTLPSALALSNDSLLATPGSLDFASGGSGRSIFTTFAPQSLVNPGDTLTASISFTTPDSVSVDLNDTFRVGLFDTSTSPGFTGEVPSFGFTPTGGSGTPLNPLVDASGSPILDAAGNLQFGGGFNQNLIASATSIEPGLNITGFTSETNVNDGLVDDGTMTGTLTTSGDISLRFQDPNLANRSGRLLGTTAGFITPDFGEGPNVIPENSFPPNTDLTYEFSIELLGDIDGNGLLDNVAITTEFAGEVFTTPTTPTALDANGFAIDQSALPVPTILTGTTFDLFAIGVSGDAFGTSSVVGEPDNGIDITNVTVTFTESVPEPGSAGLLLSGLAALGLFRRRK